MHGLSWLACNDGVVISEVLGDGLLENDWPKTLALVWSSKLGVSWPILVEWDVVVNHNGDGDAHSVHVDGVDTLVVEGWVGEKLHEAFWVLGNGSHGGQSPAVAKRSLLDVIEVDAIGTPKRVAGGFWENVGNTLPDIPALVLHGLLLIELRVSPLALGFEKLGEVWLRSGKALEWLSTLKTVHGSDLSEGLSLSSWELKIVHGWHGLDLVSESVLTEEGPGKSKDCE